MSKACESKSKSKSKSTLKSTSKSSYNCKYCGKTFSCASNRQKHLRQSAGKTQFKCTFCDYSETRRCLLRLHEEKEHRRGGLFRCPQPGCNFARREKDLVRNHQRTHKAKALTCPYADSGSGCEYTTNLRTSMRRHTKTHEKDSEKKHKCKLCDYRCHELWSLTLHMRAHVQERPFKCKFEGCNYAAKGSSQLFRHVRAVHKKLRPFKCPFCSYECSEKENLMRHQLYRHPNGQFSSDSDSDSGSDSDSDLDRHGDAQIEEDPLKLD